MADKEATIATDREIEVAMERVRSERDDTPTAVAVKFIASYNIFIVFLKNGGRLLLQRELLQGMQNATKSQLGHIEILGRGTGLRWPDLDVDLYIPALAQGIVGSKHWMREMGQKGGRVTGGAKANSSRENGAKGGRPKKERLLDSGAKRSGITPPDRSSVKKKTRKSSPLQSVR